MLITQNYVQNPPWSILISDKIPLGYLNLNVSFRTHLFPLQGGGVVGHKIDTYVRPTPEKIDQFRWKFFMKKGAGRRQSEKYEQQGQVR